MISTNESLYIAVDIGGTTIKMGICAPSAALASDSDSSAGSSGGLSDLWVCRSVISTDTEDHGKNILSDIAAEISRLTQEAGIPTDQIQGLGIGVPGPVITAKAVGEGAAAEQRQLVNGCVNLGWEGLVDVIAQMRSMTGIKHICLLNDANAAALGEYWFGPAGRPSGSAVMVAIGTGIGCGIIEGKGIIEGTFGAAGEIGHMPITPAHPFFRHLREADPSIPERSDLEHFVSAINIARLAQRALETSDDPSQLRANMPLTAKALFDAAKKGDEFALRVTDFFFDTLAQGLASVTSVIDPDLYIIGGGLSGAGDFLLDGVKDAYQRLVFPPSMETAFRLAELGNDAGLLGSIVPLIVNYEANNDI